MGCCVLEEVALGSVCFGTEVCDGFGYIGISETVAKYNINTSPTGHLRILNRNNNIPITRIHTCFQQPINPTRKLTTIEHNTIIVYPN